MWLNQISKPLPIWPRQWCFYNGWSRELIPFTPSFLIFLSVCWASSLGIGIDTISVVCIHPVMLQDFKISLAPLVLIPARSFPDFTLPVLPLQWSPNAVTFLWVPFFILSLFSWQNNVFLLIALFGYMLFASNCVGLSVTYHVRFRKHKTSTVYLAGLDSGVCW